LPRLLRLPPPRLMPRRMQLALPKTPLALPALLPTPPRALPTPPKVLRKPPRALPTLPRAPWTLPRSKEPRALPKRRAFGSAVFFRPALAQFSPAEPFLLVRETDPRLFAPQCRCQRATREFGTVVLLRKVRADHVLQPRAVEARQQRLRLAVVQVPERS